MGRPSWPVGVGRKTGLTFIPLGWPRSTRSLPLKSSTLSEESSFGMQSPHLRGLESTH